MVPVQHALGMLLFTSSTHCILRNCSCFQQCLQVHLQVCKRQSGLHKFLQTHLAEYSCRAAKIPSAFCSAGLPPVAVSHHSSRSPGHSGGIEAARALPPRRRRPKQPQPTLVIMPDGQSLCFALRLPDSNRPPPAESSTVKQDGIQHASYQTQDDVPGQAVEPPVPATLDSAHELAEHDARLPGQIVQRTMQS